MAAAQGPGQPRRPSCAASRPDSRRSKNSRISSQSSTSSSTRRMERASPFMTFPDVVSPLIASPLRRIEVATGLYPFVRRGSVKDCKGRGFRSPRGSGIARRRRPRRRCRAARRRRRGTSGRRRRARRPASRSGPRPIACISTLPDGRRLDRPGEHGRPQASAVNWQSRAFCDPPPTTWIVRIVVPRISSSRSIVQRYFSARLSRRSGRTPPRRPATAWPVLRQKAASRAGMSPGARNDGSSGSTSAANGRAASAGGAARRRTVATGPGPGPAALLHQPEPHDVLQAAGSCRPRPPRW